MEEGFLADVLGREDHGYLTRFAGLARQNTGVASGLQAHMLELKAEREHVLRTLDLQSRATLFPEVDIEVVHGGEQVEPGEAALEEFRDLRAEVEVDWLRLLHLEGDTGVVVGKADLGNGWGHCWCLLRLAVVEQDEVGCGRVGPKQIAGMLSVRPDRFVRNLGDERRATRSLVESIDGAGLVEGEMERLAIGIMQSAARKPSHGSLFGRRLRKHRRMR